MSSWGLNTNTAPFTFCGDDSIHGERGVMTASKTIKLSEKELQLQNPLQHDAMVQALAMCLFYLSLPRN